MKFIGSRGFHAMSFDTMLICTFRRIDDARMSYSKTPRSLEVAANRPTSAGLNRAFSSDSVS